MALHLINISVDTADPTPEHIPEDLSINDQESVVEIVLEQLLGYEDAIKEYDDHDTEDHDKKTSFKINLIAHSIPQLLLNRNFQIITRQRFPDDPPFLKTEFQTLDSPPPKV